MKSSFKMLATGELTFTATLLLLTILAKPTSAANTSNNYCLDQASGGSSCGFVSMEQCRETMRGRNGWCSKAVDFGAAYSDPASSFAYSRGGRAVPADGDIYELHKREMPVKGVGAE
jgi:hypothetical protein